MVTLILSVLVEKVGVVLFNNSIITGLSNYQQDIRYSLPTVLELYVDGRVHHHMMPCQHGNLTKP